MSGHRAKPTRDVVVVGASAGGIQAFAQLLQQLPVGFPAALALTLHRSPTFPSLLPQVLNRNARLQCIEPMDGQRLDPGLAYVAPPDRHMTIEGDVIRLNRGPKQHHARPAIDPMFQSAAESCGSRVIGVLLTGNLSDGVAGLIEINRHGGIGLAQDPQEALFPSMPLNAIRFDHVDAVFRVDQLAELLSRLVGGEDLADIGFQAGMEGKTQSTG